MALRRAGEFARLLDDTHEGAELFRASQAQSQASRTRHECGSLQEPEQREWAEYFLWGEPRDDNWYRTLFASAGKRLTGDISPAYSKIGIGGTEHAKRLAPDAKVIMLVRNPVDRDLSHLIHIATSNAFGTSKVGAVLDAIARCLRLDGDMKEQRQLVRSRFHLKRKQTQNMDHLLGILSQLAGRPVSFNDVPGILGKRISVEEVQAARSSQAFKGQRTQSNALERWRGMFGENFRAFLYDDLKSAPEQLLARITAFLGHESGPEDPFDPAPGFQPQYLCHRRLGPVARGARAGVQA